MRAQLRPVWESTLVMRNSLSDGFILTYYFHLPATNIEMPRYSEDQLLDAYIEVTENRMSVRKAAQKHGVPATTLSARLNGRPPRAEAQQHRQRISPVQETRLTSWILRQEALGYAPSHSQMRAAVEALLKSMGDNKPLGKNWIEGFIARNPSIKTKKGQRMEASRFNGFTPKAINWYFDIREKEYGWIKPELTHNVDEGGIMAGFGKRELI